MYNAYQMPKYESIATLAPVPYFITAMASSVVRPVRDSSSLNLRTALSASILSLFRSRLSPASSPPRHESKNDVRLDPSSSGSPATSAASDHAWTDEACTARSSWALASRSSWGGRQEGAAPPSSAAAERPTERGERSGADANAVAATETIHRLRSVRRADDDGDDDDSMRRGRSRTESSSSWEGRCSARIGSVSISCGYVLATPLSHRSNVRPIAGPTPSNTTGTATNIRTMSMRCRQ
mmetsp:Transcript_61728/g.182315  ORF Transcript_61728/g.182315 Transcript_61728/m.182315 type:complete len:239 (-) Transcript_61728:25-741(-)